MSGDAAIMEPSRVGAWRKEQRAQLLAERESLGAAQHRAASWRIEKRLAAHFLHLSGKCLGFYWPFRREFSPLEFIEAHLAGGGRAGLPVVLGKNQALEFREWHPGCAMYPGIWEIPYPAQGALVVPDALLVPLVGFDAAGYRLGYGGGYYDRTLAGPEPRPTTVGIGFELGRLASIFPEAHDQPMDFIVTEAGTWLRQGGKLVEIR